MASPDPASAPTGLARSALLLAGALVAAALSMAGTPAQGAPVLAPAQVNSGAQVDTATVGTRIPLILVHGLGGSTEAPRQPARRCGHQAGHADRERVG